jgi:hypothetical protein
VLQHRDELTAFVGGEISRIITEQRELEGRYEMLITERGALKGLANKTKYKSVQTEIQDVSHALRESTKSLCRNLKDNPNIAGNLVKIMRERNEVIDVLQSTINELQQTGTYSSLIQRVSLDKGVQLNVKEVWRKERDSAAAVKQLDRDLAAERQDHAQIVMEQRAEMGVLKERLLNIRTRASVDVRFQRAEANARSASVMRGFDQIQMKQQTENRGLKTTLQKEEVVHRETCGFLKKKQIKLAKDLEEWEVRYEKDVEEMDTTYQKLLTERNTNFEILSKLKARKEQENALIQASIEAEQTLKDMAEKDSLENERRGEAAHLIQAFGKMFIKRLKERKEAGGGKKEKKKKGGKKGKK